VIFFFVSSFHGFQNQLKQQKKRAEGILFANQKTKNPKPQKQIK